MSDHPPEPDDRRLTGAKLWLSRLAFSFLILGFVAGYEGWKAQGRGEAGRATMLLVAAAAGVGLGLASIRLRHRR